MANSGYGGNKFLDPEKILFQAGLGKGQVMADLGAGSGYYVLAAGKMVGGKGTVYAVDLLESALEHIGAEARLRLIRNVRTIRADLDNPVACGSIPAGTCDMVLMGNVVHEAKNRKNLFIEAYRLLKTGGHLLILEWNDQRSPIGPAPEVRVSPQEVTALAEGNSLKFLKRLDADQYHYCLLFSK
ncbi:MAG: class I SAM-dependent methyltransferase [Candidatus Saccharibacteria bacterium]